MSLGIRILIIGGDRVPNRKSIRRQKGTGHSASCRTNSINTSAFSRSPFLSSPPLLFIFLCIFIPWYLFSPDFLLGLSNVTSVLLLRPMSAAQMLSMDFDHKTPFLESSFDSSFNYMDSGLDYFQYPPPSPTLGVSVGRQFLSSFYQSVSHEFK
jgi:hypothetical protein